MVLYIMEDSRAFTDWTPSCEANAKLAIVMGAKSHREYRSLLVKKGTLDKMRAHVGQPVPGSSIDVKYPYQNDAQVPKAHTRSQKAS